MCKHATRLTLALIALLELSAAATRHPRSLWPWSSSQTTDEPLIPDKHAEILRQSGYGDYLDLSRHPVWKIHKYEGIELKPVQVEAEIIKPAEVRNPVSSVAPLTESQVTEQPPDLSFLDNLGGLAYFLPDADDEEEETQKANVLAGAIASEEQSHPGFFAKLWSKLWGSDDSKNAEALEDDSALLQIALPATKENYAEITLVKPSAQLADVQPTLNQPHQYAFTAGASQAAKPVDKWYKPAGHFSRSQAWVQSWNPNAAYNVHVEGPSEYPAEHVATVQAYTANQFQKKISKDEEVEQKSADTVNEEEKNAEVPSELQMSVPKDEEKKEAAVVNNDSQISMADSEKKDGASVNSDPQISVSEDATESAIADNEPPRNVPEDEKAKEPVAVVVAEGQGQGVAGELESSTATSSTRARSLRQKAVNALKKGMVPKVFLKQLNVSDQEIDDFVNNRESSNEAWEKIKSHLHNLAPRFPAVRRIFFV